MQQAMWDKRKPDLRDRCGWCIFGKHERCQRTYAYEKHHGIIRTGRLGATHPRTG